MKIIRNNIPNAITSLNLLCGSMACIAAFSGSEMLCGGLRGYEWAFILIGLSAVADFLDGLVARLLHAVSAIGKELDSLSDLVSFGLAPALILYNLMVEQGAGGWALVSLLLPVFGALRLARFNVDTNQTTTFTGLPIPANAIFWVGFTAWYATHPVLKQNWAQYLQVIATVAFVVVLGLPGLAAAIALYVLLSIVKREK